MDIKTLIKELTFLKDKYGENIQVMLDDYITPACLSVDNVYVEKRNNDENKENVVVIRS